MKRIASVDILRALTMLTMLFVNDFAGMSGLPLWLHHAAADEDMLGFSDLVFPAFIFCMGLSIPADFSSRALILGFWPGGWTHPAICAAALTAGIPGLLKALVFSFLIIGLTWVFERIHLKLKI